MTGQNILPEFQKYLSSRQLTAERSIPFFTSWVAMFLTFAKKNTYQDTNILIPQFLDHLKIAAAKEDWQIRQAHQAIELYLFHYLKTKTCPGTSSVA